jgi:putative ABC transport system permease protein
MIRYLRRLRSLFTHRHDEDDLSREMAAHLALLEAEYQQRGLSPDEARLAARRAMGSVALAQDLHRDARSFVWLEDLRRDLRHTARSLGRTPGFTAVAVLTLALGIGANVAIFGLLYHTLLKPLPFERPDQLVTVATHIPQVADRFASLPVTAPDFREYRRSNAVFSGLSALRGRDFNLTGSGEPERLHGARVSAEFFSMLGIRPELGRTFTPEEDQDGRDGVAIISHALWERRFGLDPAITSRTILLDGRPHTIVGIMPAGLLFPVGRQLDPLVTFGSRVDIWKPLAFTRDELGNEGNFDFAVIGRLKPGISAAAAQEHMDGLARRNLERIRRNEPVDVELRTRITPLHEVFVAEGRSGLLMLEAAVGLLLVIACVNLTNVFLARSSSREHEFAVRTALGAGRGRLIRQLLTETLVVAGAGGVAGVALAVWAGPLLVLYGPANAVARDWTLGGPVLAFAAFAALATGLLVGAVPAIKASSEAVRFRLRHAARIVSDRTRKTLITVEVALCTSLLGVAGLLLHSFVNVLRVDTGFAVERVLAVDLALPARQYSESQTVLFYRDLAASVRELPGVAAAGAISLLPIAHEGVMGTVLLDTDTIERVDRPTALRRSVTPGFFSAMDVPLRAGRAFEEQEPAPVVIISEGLARGLWPGITPAAAVGRGLRLDNDEPILTVVGVVGDVRADAVDRTAPNALYQPLGQDVRRGMTLVVRTNQEPGAAVSGVRATVAALDPNLPIAAMRTMREVVAASIAARRFQMLLVSLLSLVALVLAVVGIYGVTSYTVASRTREIGLRVALGAQQRDVLRSVLVEGLKPVAIGLVLGIVGGQIAAQWIRAALYGIGVIDPAALGGVVAVLLLTALIACYVPAYRASTVDPMGALRAE